MLPKIIKENATRILVEESPNYCVIIRKSDEKVAFEGSLESMLVIYRRMENSSRKINSQIENHMKRKNNGLPWRKYQRWLKDHSSDCLDADSDRLS